MKVETLVFQFDFDKDQLNYDLLLAACNQLDHLGLEEKPDQILLYVDAAKVDLEDISNALAKFKLDKTVNVSRKVVKHQNWNTTWENYFEPILINDKVYIRAEFHSSQPELQEIIIQPKMAFGTGHHATTQAMIQLMMTINLQNQEVLDMGCGTGVLGIYALKLKAKSVNFVDNDHWCYENTKENLEKNQLKPQFVQLADRLAHDQYYDIILANIQRNIILDHLPDYHKHLKSNGFLLVSGFYEKDADLILAKAHEYNFDLAEKEIIDDWCALKLKKS